MINRVASQTARQYGTATNIGGIFMSASRVTLIRAQELSALVQYSQQHIRRLEAAGKFPKRVRIGHNRIGWVRAEVEHWLNSKVDER